MATLKAPFALDRSLNTTEENSRNIADVLAEGLSHITGRTASEVEYDNTESGLTSDDVQGAIDELSERPTLPSVDVQTAVDEFSTYNGGLLSSLEVTLEPIQDLHGYPEPWVGGAGKNKANPNNLEVGYYSTNGYNNSPNFKTTEPIAVENGQTYSGSLFNSNDLTERHNAVLTTYSSGDTTNAIRQVVGESITIQSGESFIRIRNNSDQTPLIQSGDFYYQLEKSASATAYEPYENICPISGHTQVDVGDDGKNRFNPNSYESFDITGGGVIRYGHEFGSGSYTLINNGTDSSGYFYRIVAKDYSSYGTSVQITNNTSVNVNVDDAHFLRVFTASWDDTADKIAVIEGTDETFVPYNGYQITVNLGGTYYSGILDVVSGVFVPNTAEVDLGSLTWTKDSSKTFYAFITDSLTGLQDMWCEVLDSYPENYKLNEYNNYPDNIIARNSTQKNVYVKCTTYEDGTASDFKTAMSGYKLVYELATPTPIQLSPTMVKALVGENHLSAPLDGQEITESKYKQMFTFDDVIAYIQSLS